MRPGDAHDAVLWAFVAITPILYLTSDEAANLTKLDVLLLREMGADDRLLAQLVALGSEPSLCLRCDFEGQRVLVVDSTD